MASKFDLVLQLVDGRNLTVSALDCLGISPPGTVCPNHAVVEVDIEGDNLHCVENDFESLRQVVADAHERAHTNGRI